jgi:hypothetical protein
MNDKRKVGRPKGPDTVRLETRVPRTTKTILDDMACFHGISLGAVIQMISDEYYWKHEFKISTSSARTDTLENL